MVIEGDRPLVGRRTEVVRADFVLHNRGRSPVRIVGVRSSCGCTVTSVSPEVVGPGERSIIVAESSVPPVGSRTTRMVVETDSIADRELILRLTVRGRDAPPFLVGARGHLAFTADGPAHDLGSTRELTVTLIEPESERREPLVETDLEFIRIDPARTEERPFRETGFIARRHVYEVGFSGPPPPAFHGRLTVSDPWLEGHVEALRVSGRSRPRIRSIPARPRLGPEGTARFTLLWDDSIESVEASEAGAVRLRRTSIDRARRFADFEATPDPGAAGPEAICALRLIASRGREGRFELPLVLEDGGHHAVAE